MQSMLRFTKNGSIASGCVFVKIETPPQRNPPFGLVDDRTWGLRVHFETENTIAPQPFTVLLPLTTTRGTWIVKGKELIPKKPDNELDQKLAEDLSTFQNLLEGQKIRWMNRHGYRESLTANAFLYSKIKALVHEVEREGLTPGRTGLHHLMLLDQTGRLEHPLGLSDSTTQLIMEAPLLTNSSKELPDWIKSEESDAILSHSFCKKSRLECQMPFVEAEVRVDRTIPPGMAIASRCLLKNMHTVEYKPRFGSRQFGHFKQTEAHPNVIRSHPRIGDPIGILEPNGQSTSPRIMAKSADEGLVLRVNPMDSPKSSRAPIVVIPDSRSMATPLVDLHPDILSSDAVAKNLLSRLAEPEDLNLAGLKWRHFQKNHPKSNSRLLSLQILACKVGCYWTIDSTGIGIETSIDRNIKTLPLISESDIAKQCENLTMAVPGVCSVPLLVNPKIKEGTAALSADLLRAIRQSCPGESTVTIQGANSLRLRQRLGHGVANIAVHPTDAAILNSAEIVCFASPHHLQATPHDPNWLTCLILTIRDGDEWEVSSLLFDLAGSGIRVPLNHPAARLLFGELSHFNRATCP
jgi:hypothetical protein